MVVVVMRPASHGWISRSTPPLNGYLAYCTGANARELEFRATSLSTLAQMVASGAGVTLLPRLAVGHRDQARRSADPPLRRSSPAPHPGADLAQAVTARGTIQGARRADQGDPSPIAGWIVSSPFGFIWDALHDSRTT